MKPLTAPPLLALLVLGLALSGRSSAQNAMPFSGYNADVIAGSTGSAPQSVDSLNGQTFYDSSNSQGASGAFPVGTTITGTSTGGTYVLPSGTGDDDLLLGYGGSSSGTLTFTTPVTGATKLEILGTSANGSSTLTYTLDFSGVATPATGTITFNDWYDGGTPSGTSDLAGLGRTANGGGYDSGHPNQFQLYGDVITLPVADQSATLTGITFAYTSGADGHSAASIFAVSGNGTPVVPEPSTWAMLLGGVALLGLWRLRLRPRVS